MSEAPVRAPMVTVRGEGHREVEPDLATVSVLLHAAGGAAGAVRSKLAAGSSRLAAALQDFAAAVESSSTGGLHIAPEFDRRAPSRIRGYRGTFRTSVVLHDFAVLSDLVLAVGGLEDSQLDGPWWSLRADNPVHQAVRLDAIADARRRAEDYAAAFGTTLAALLEVSDLGGGVGGGVPRPMAFAVGRSTAEPAFEFEPAPQTVSGQVTVRFTLASVSGM